MLNNTHIVLRIPGLFSRIERRFQNIPDNIPILICTGEGDRALVLSACNRAIEQGARPGMRIGQIRGFRGKIIPSSPLKYRSEMNRLLAILGRDLPNPRMIRTGVVHSLWSRGRRFLPQAIGTVREHLRLQDYPFACGIAPGDAVAEIAAAIAPVGEQLEVLDHEVPTFLASCPLQLLPDLSPDQIAMFKDIGVHRFGHLTELPVEVLRSMLGPDGLALRRIAIHGVRGPEPQQWLGRRRLGGDTASIDRVHRAITELVADGLIHVLVHLGHVPRAMLLGILYTDGKRTGARLVSKRPEHEGSWQKLALHEIENLWQRRVRIAEVRLSVDWGGRPSNQLSLFVPARQQFRDRRLAQAVTRVRDRWGRELVRYVV